jgi:hypothetical protein
MPVEIRELVIKTNVLSAKAQVDDAAINEKLASLKQQVIQECIKAIKDKVFKRSFDR